MRVPFSHDTVCWPEKRWITDVHKYFHLFALSVEKTKKQKKNDRQVIWDILVKLFFKNHTVSFLNKGEISLFSKNLGMFFLTNLLRTHY